MEGGPPQWQHRSRRSRNPSPPLQRWRLGAHVSSDLHLHKEMACTNVDLPNGPLHGPAASAKQYLLTKRRLLWRLESGSLRKRALKPLTSPVQAQEQQ